MFNLSSILTTAAQAMAKHFVASDSMYQQYKAFCSQLGLEKQFQACCCSTSNMLDRIWDKINTPATSTANA